MEKYFVDEILKQAKRGFKKGEIPVGCVIVEKEKIVARGYNKSEKTKNPLKHAEMIAIEKACKKKRSKYLKDCTIYVTSEPCVMCAGAIAQAKIKKIIYLLDNEKFGFTKQLKTTGFIMNHKIKTEKLISNNEVLDLMKKFFKNKR
jgi:tRNA(adenine34) deaminase